MRRHTLSLSAEAALALAGSALAVPRCFHGGIPYAPQGTLMDFTSSPRHVGLYELQADLDRRAGREHTGMYAGSTFIPGKGAQPAHPARPMPFYTGTYAASDKERSESFDKLKPWEQEYIRQRVPQRERRGAIDTIKPDLGDNYQADVRVDPEFDELPESLRAARQSLLMNQSDSYGEALRGVVPPAPPIDPQTAPRAYQSAQVQLSPLWYLLVSLFAAMFFLMARSGK